MDLIREGLREAFWLLINNDEDIYAIAWRSVFVSGMATLISLAFGVLIGSVIAFRKFPGRMLALSVVNTGMGMPPVVVGLIIAILLWRSGPFGELEWIYTRKAMIIAQAVIVTPIIAGFTAASLAALHPRLKLQVYALGASRLQMLWLLLREVKLPLLAAVMAGFGAAISEVGASLMVGGNDPDDTRVMTGAIILEQSRGEFGTALAFGIILLALTLIVNLVFTWVQVGRQPDRWTEGAPPDDGAISWNRR